MQQTDEGRLKGKKKACWLEIPGCEEWHGYGIPGFSFCFLPIQERSIKHETIHGHRLKKEQGKGWPTRIENLFDNIHPTLASHKRQNRPPFMVLAGCGAGLPEDPSSISKAGWVTPPRHPRGLDQWNQMGSCTFASTWQYSGGRRQCAMEQVGTSPSLLRWCQLLSAEPSGRMNFCPQLAAMKLNRHSPWPPLPTMDQLPPSAGPSRKQSIRPHLNLQAIPEQGDCLQKKIK